MSTRKQSADTVTLSVVTQKHFWLEIRRALLIIVALIDEMCKVRPTIKEQRDFWKRHNN